jgi:hypothetical protein
MPKNQPERIIDRKIASATQVYVGAGVGGGGGGVTDHGLLTGLADDDHTQYHTDARGDARYLKLSGGTMTGDIGMATNGTVDGVDISEHVLDPDAHHDQAHSIIGSDHTLAGATALDLVGATAPTTIALITPSSNPGTNPAVLRTDAAGVVRLAKLEVGPNPAMTLWGTDNPATNPDLEFAANAVLAAQGSIYHYFDSDNTGTGALCVWGINGRVTGTAAELMRLTEAGRLGIGDNAPDDALDVVGYIHATTGVKTPEISTTGDLAIAPAGNVLVAEDTTLRSDAWTAGFGGTGYGITNPASGAARLDIREIYAEEMEVTAFTADLMRLQIGETWLGQSGGITRATFTTPSAIGGTVRVYFEDNPQVSGELFTAGDYVLFQIIDRSGGGLTVAQVWGTVNTYFDGDEGSNAQSWLLTLRSGPTNFAVAKGAIAVGFGQTGSGYIHSSVLTGGPFTRWGSWATNPYTPANRTYHAQAGNLYGLADYGSNNHYGIAAAKSLAAAVADYSGFTIDETAGMRLFNTAFQAYSGGDQTLDIAADGKMWIGSTGDKRFYWDGTDLRIGGSGTGAWYISANKISSSNIRLLSSATASSARIEVGVGGTGTGSELTGGIRGTDGAASGVVFWCGANHTDRNNAPFRVLLDGSLIATDVTITAGGVAITNDGVSVVASDAWDVTKGFLFKAGTTNVGGVFSNYLAASYLSSGFWVNTINNGSSAAVANIDTNLYLRTVATGTGKTATSLLEASHISGAKSASISVIATSTTRTINVQADEMTIASGTVWHSENDGSGSGLNADLLDGYHYSSFARLAGATFTGALESSSTIGGAWTNITAADAGGIGDWVSGYQGRVKKLGDFVIMQGRFDPVNSVTPNLRQVIFTIPSGFRPARNMDIHITAHWLGPNQTSGADSVYCDITSGGVVAISLIRDWSDYNYVDFSAVQWSTV